MNTTNLNNTSQIIGQTNGRALSVNTSTFPEYKSEMATTTVKVTGRTSTLTDLDKEKHDCVLSVFNDNEWVRGRGGSIGIGGLSNPVWGSKQMVFVRLHGGQKSDSDAYDGQLNIECIRFDGTMNTMMSISNVGVLIGGLYNEVSTEALEVRGSIKSTGGIKTDGTINLIPTASSDPTAIGEMRLCYNSSTHDIYTMIDPWVNRQTVDLSLNDFQIDWDGNTTKEVCLVTASKTVNTSKVNMRHANNTVYWNNRRYTIVNYTANSIHVGCSDYSMFDGRNNATWCGYVIPPYGWINTICINSGNWADVKVIGLSPGAVWEP